MKTLNVKMTACAFAAAALLAACGGGGTTPDTTAPTLAITDDISVTTATSAVTFTFTFSEAVGSSFVSEDIVVSGGTAGTLTKVSDTVYTLVVTPTDNSAGTINVSVAASAFTDIAGNNNTASVSASQAFDTTTPTPPVVNLLTNGDFENGSAGWSGNAANVVTEGGNSYNFANVTSAGNPWDVTLSRVVNIPTQGVRYKLSFTGSSNRTRALKAGIGLNLDPWTNTVQDITLTTAPQTFELTLTANFANANSRVIFDMGHDTGHVVIDNVVLEVIEEESPEGNLLTNGDFENGSAGWSGNAANVVTEGGNSYNFANVTTAGNPWDVNLSRVVNIPTQGVRYKLSFTGSSNRTRALKAGIGLNLDPWTNTVQDITLTTTPQTFELTLTANFANANSRVIFDMGHDTGHVVIDNVVLEVIE
jgi:hypothetical protein